MISSAHAAWLETRGLDVELASRLGVESRGSNIAFPYKRRGEIVSLKLRNTTTKKFSFDRTGAPLVLWNLESLETASSSPEEPLIVTEGELDAIALLQAGFRYVVSVPNGGDNKRTTEPTTVSRDTGFKYLWGGDNLIPELAEFRRIILATDGDEVGQTLRDELSIRLGEIRCDFVEWPAGCKDANDVLVAHGIEFLRVVVAAAKPMRPSQSVALADLPSHEQRLSVTSGWSALDKHLRISPPELVVITGIPGHGKSQWARSLCFHLAESHGWRGTLIATEDEPSDIRKDALRFIGRPGNAFTPGVDITSDSTIHEQRCAPACNFDPVTGVIGAQF